MDSYILSLVPGGRGLLFHRRVVGALAGCGGYIGSVEERLLSFCFVDHVASPGF